MRGVYHVLFRLNFFSGEVHHTDLKVNRVHANKNLIRVNLSDHAFRKISIQGVMVLAKIAAQNH